MKLLPVAIIGLLALAGLSATRPAQGNQAGTPEVESPEAGDAAETDAPEADAQDAPQEPLIFRWYDVMGVPHDTTNATTIPPSSKFEVKGGLLNKGYLKRHRSWWRARMSRIQAELRGAQDELSRANGALQLAVDQDESGARQAELATKVDAWKSMVSRREREIKALKAEAAKSKIPQRWLKE